MHFSLKFYVNKGEIIKILVKSNGKIGKIKINIKYCSGNYKKLAKVIKISINTKNNYIDIIEIAAVSFP